MPWSHYLYCLLAGLVLANAVPHFVHGISGDRFPTPFATPPGKGLSSATTNVAWSLVNIVLGYVFFRLGDPLTNDLPSELTFLAGIAAISLLLSVQFAKKNPR